MHITWIARWLKGALCVLLIVIILSGSVLLTRSLPVTLARLPDHSHDAALPDPAVVGPIRPLGDVLHPNGTLNLPAGFRGNLDSRGWMLIDADFGPDLNERVLSLALQPDGKILIGGMFSTIGGESRDCIARLHPDGTLDVDFGPGANGSVRSIAVQADGGILIGGWFTAIDGQARHRIARLHPDGTLDTGFDPGANDAVFAIAVQADGKILIGGRFTAIGSQVRHYIARLDPDGAVDADFDPNANQYILTLAGQPDGRILVGGDFTTIAGLPRDRIARLHVDGTVDADFDPGADQEVTSLVLQADGKILVGGLFTEIGSQPRDCIARLDPDGAVDAGFDPGANSYISTLAVRADGQILVGGLFTEIGGQARRYIARLDPDGALDADFDPSANHLVYALAVQADGKILVGGLFTEIGGQPRSYLARLALPEAALYDLSVDQGGTQVTWLRSGSAPEVTRVTFEFSTGAESWSLLGEAERVAGGWQLAGLNLPADQVGLVRARGDYSTGLDNGSLSIHESIRQVYVHNQPPVADAGPNQVVGTLALVTLDGSASSDPDGHYPLAYSWTQTGGTTVTLSSRTVASPTFTAPTDPAVLTFALIVTDSLGLASAPNTVVITVLSYRVYLPLLLRH